jgi:tRNA-dihydrouridine synthase B
MPASLTDPWRLGSLEVPNRVLLAPLAGIGNWFVRLQAKRYGAGMAVSEMVSSHAIFYGNEKTCHEMLRIDSRERSAGPVSIQLFGEDPAIMRSAAAYVAAETDADAIDINMGCPVPKVRKTGAGAAMLDDHDLAVAVAKAAREGAVRARAAAHDGTAHDGTAHDGTAHDGTAHDGTAHDGTGHGGAGAVARDGAAVAREGAVRARAYGENEMPITVKLRSGLRPGDESGYELAHRLVEEAGVAAIAFHPRSAAVHHKGVPDYGLAARLVETLPAPVILTGGLADARSVREAYERTGAAAVMLARGALGNPWLFRRLLVGDEREPDRAEVLVELTWTIERAVEHLGEARATRYLRKFYLWYLARLDLDPSHAKRLGDRLQTAATLDEVRGLLALDRAPERALA